MVAGPSPTLVDRVNEQRELRDLLATGRPQLALLTGRRRIGKSYLLTHTFEPELAFFFTAARTSPEINRRTLLADLARWSGEGIEAEDYPTWRSVFNLLLDLRAPEPLVLIIDEFQYLASDEAGLAEVASELNAAWERRRAPRSLLLILSGSVAGTMEALASGGAPLYGRFAWKQRLRPFGYWYAAELAPFVDPRDRARAYGIFGGTPLYLAAIDPDRSLADNAARLLLSPRGEVRNLVETALDQEEGLRDVASYQAILRAVSDGRTRRNEIGQHAGLNNDNALRDKLGRLLELGYLTEIRNIDAPKNAAVRYDVADPAIRTHQRFVEPNASLLERNDPLQVWHELVEPRLSTHMGHTFERIATQAYDRLRASRDLPPVRTWESWEGRDREKRSLEIDLVARLAGGGVLTGAVKWNRTPLSREVHDQHVKMLERAADAGQRWAHEARERKAWLLYVAAGGFEEGFVRAVKGSGYRAIWWDLEDIYAAA